MNCFKAASDKVGGRLRLVFFGFKDVLASDSTGEGPGAAAVEGGVGMKVGGYAGGAKKASGSERKAVADTALSGNAQSRVGGRRDMHK